MSKAFTKESDNDDEDDLPDDIGGLPAGAKNYMTPDGFARMREELMARLSTSSLAISSTWKPYSPQ